MSYKVADVDCHNLTIEHRFPRDEQKDRHLSFFLTGPAAAWRVFESHEVEFTGNETVRVDNSSISLNEVFPFEIEVRPWYFYDRTALPESFPVKTKVLVLHFKTSKSEEELSDDDFVALSTPVADDLALISSFVARRWITWYRSQLETTSGVKTFVRRVRESSRNDVDRFRMVVEPRDADEVIRKAFMNLRKLRDEGMNLYMPILYFVAGMEATYVEEQFSLQFLSLERIKDMHAIKEGIDSNVPGSKFSRLRNKLSAVIKEELQEATVVEKVRRKIPELNRPSLRMILDHMLARYNVTWQDLYPQGGDFTLIRTRDNLFHSSAEIDIDLLIKEKHRLQALLERVILSMLGWSSHRNSPPSYEKEWLAEG